MPKECLKHGVKAMSWRSTGRNPTPVTARSPTPTSGQCMSPKSDGPPSADGAVSQVGRGG